MVWNLGVNGVSNAIWQNNLTGRVQWMSANGVTGLDITPISTGSSVATVTMTFVSCGSYSGPVATSPLPMYLRPIT
jgi:hypothetical protein